MSKNGNKSSSPSIISQLFDAKYGILAKKATIIALIFLVIYVIIFVTRLVNYEWEDCSPYLWQFLTDTLSAVVGVFVTAVTIAWLSIALNKETEEIFLSHMSDTVNKAFGDSHFLESMEFKITESLLVIDDSLKGIAEEKRKIAARLIANNLLNNSNPCVIDFLMNSLEKANSGWRSNFEYISHLDPYLDPKHPELKYTLKQVISYTQNFGKFQPQDKRNVKIGFALNNDVLDEWLKQDGWFFREIIHDEFHGKDDKSALGFVRNILNVELSTGINEDNQERRVYDIPNIVRHCNNLGETVGIELNYPFPENFDDKFFAKVKFLNNRKERHFLVTLPTLTEGAKLELTYATGKFVVAGHDFFTHSSGKVTSLANDTKCGFECKNQWLFPVSGVMFVWDEI